MDGPSFLQRVSVHVATATATEPLQELQIQKRRRGFTAAHILSHYGRILPGFMHDGCKIQYMKGSPCHLAGRQVILELEVLRPSLPWFIY